MNGVARQSDLVLPCQYCLADARYTRITDDKDRRCPVCGADYIGPRRDAEIAAIRDAGLLESDR